MTESWLAEIADVMVPTGLASEEIDSVGGIVVRSPWSTLRCLREDLGIPLPAVTVPLDELNHPLIAKTAGTTAFAPVGNALLATSAGLSALVLRAGR
ncbi:hypothetical protein [Streptomyces sp. 6N223]|uniref:hypothetical protein n=1 Tax=Streptomyces sp. 6N223 TaxID=3457412 RepID=UPI003FD1903D